MKVVFKSGDLYLSGKPTRRHPAGFWCSDINNALTFEQWRFENGNVVWPMYFSSSDGDGGAEIDRQFRLKFPPAARPILVEVKTEEIK